MAMTDRKIYTEDFRELVLFSDTSCSAVRSTPFLCMPSKTWPKIRRNCEIKDKIRSTTKNFFPRREAHETKVRLRTSMITVSRRYVIFAIIAITIAYTFIEINTVRGVSWFSSTFLSLWILMRLTRHFLFWSVPHWLILNLTLFQKESLGIIRKIRRSNHSSSTFC